MANDKKVEVNKIDNSIVKLNGLFNDIIDNITQTVYKSDTRNEKEIKRINKSVTDVIQSELKDIKEYTGGDISTFLLKSFNEAERDSNITNKTISELDELFEGGEGNIFSAFSSRYRNQAILFEDLEIIASQLIELDEAINTTRDAIVTSDDVSATVSRTLKFKNNIDQEYEGESHIKIIEEIERKYKLLNKVKNHIVPKALKYGTYYTYVIPQSKLFEKGQKDKISRVQTMESFIDEETIDFVTENVTLIQEDDKPSMGFPKPSDKKKHITVKEAVMDMAKCINVSNDDIPIPLLENTGMLDAIMDLEKFNKTVATNMKRTNQKSSSISFDGVKNTKEGKDKNEDFKFVEDCYIKLLDPKRVIPVKILDLTIGYYYLHEMGPEEPKSTFNTNLALVKNDQLTEKDVINKISERIVKAFDKSYLEKNIEFKELILNALLFNENYKKKIHFQFIPAEYMCEFKVNEDEYGNGTSILIKSLFYAKLYLAMLVFNILTYLSKSADTKIYYVKNSGIDTNVVNKTMEIARDIKAKQLNFTDLLNYNTMVSKIGKGKEIFMPVGKSGERGIEFDILSGQNVDINTDILEMLKQAYINGTGVPSVIMNYINEADYAKTLVMANAKFLGRALSYQLDFNESITNFYRKVLKFTTDIPDEIINELEFAFTPPKALNNMNISDITSYTENVIEFLVKTTVGEEGEQPEDIGTIKDLIRLELAKEVAPILPWERVEEIKEDCILRAKQKAISKKGESISGSSSSTDSY